MTDKKNIALIIQIRSGCNAIRLKWKKKKQRKIHSLQPKWSSQTEFRWKIHFIERIKKKVLSIKFHSFYDRIIFQPIYVHNQFDIHVHFSKAHRWRKNGMMNCFRICTGKKKRNLETGSNLFSPENNSSICWSCTASHLFWIIYAMYSLSEFCSQSSAVA